MRVLVVGATGRTGRAVVDALLDEGHEVTAFARSAEDLAPRPGLRRAVGDATRTADVDAAVRGQDAVIVTLGIRDNPLGVRLLRRAGTALDVRSQGTRHVVAAMQRHGVTRLIVQSSFGVGETRHLLPPVERVVFALLLAPQIADTERQEAVVRASGLAWTLAQPVNLTDDPGDDEPYVASDGTTRGMKVSRGRVARFLAAAVQRDELIGRSVALSAAAPVAARQ